MQSDSIIGVAFAVTGNLFISFGLNLQKTSHYLRSFKWWLGFILMTSGEIENFIAYGFIPVVMVSSLGIITLISNVIIAPLIFNQKLRVRDFVGTLLASVGVILVILSLNDAVQVTDPVKFLNGVVHSLNFFGYVIITFVATLALLKKEEKSIMQNLTIVAIFGSYTVISTKLLSVMIESSFFLIFQSTIPWILLAVIIITSCLQIKYLNIALSLNSSTVVIPLHYIFFNLTIIISSIIVFKDFSQMRLTQLVLFITGITLTFLGVISICGETTPPHIINNNNTHNNNQIPEILIDESSEDTLGDNPLSTTGLLQRAKSTSELILKPIRSLNSNRRNSELYNFGGDVSGSYGSMIVGSGLIVNTFFSYANTTTGVSDIAIDTNSHN